MKRGLRTLDTFENNFGLNHKFAEYLKESYDMDLEQHFFFKYFVKIPFVKVISPKQSGSAERKRHERVNLFYTSRKEGRNWVLRLFQQLRSYRDEIETRNREEIPYSSRIVPRGLSVAE